MRGLFIIILFLIFTFIQFNLFSQNTLTGSVKNAKDQTNLVGAVISLPDIKKGGYSDENGKFEIADMPEGQYLLQCNYYGFATQIKTVKIEKGKQNYLEIEMSESVTELGEVLITGLSAASEQKRNPVPSAILKSIDLQQNIATNLIDNIAKIPSVNQISTGAAISKPVIRGLSYNRIITVYDGMRQEGQQWGDEHGIEIDEYSVERVEVIKGAGSLMYGSDGLGGVVSFITPHVLEEGKIVANYLANYQTNNQLVGNSLMTGGNVKGFYWQGRVSQKVAGNYQNRYDGKVYNSGFKEFDYNGHLGYIGKWGYSQFYASSFHQKIGMIEGERDENGHFIREYLDTDSSILEETVSAAKLKGYNLDIPRQDVRHFRAGNMTNLFIGKSRLNVNLGFQQNNRQEFGNLFAPDTANLWMRLSAYTADVKWFLPQYKGWNTTLGGAFLAQTNHNLGEEELIPEYGVQDMGAFVFSKKTFGKWDIAGGFRFDKRNIQTNEIFIHHIKATSGTILQASDSSIFTSQKSSYNNFSASFGGTYQLTEDMALKMNVARGFRAPNVAELASNGAHEGTNRYEIGTATLLPEHNWQGDLGYSLNYEHITIDASAFVNRINNYIFSEKLSSILGGDSISFSEEGDKLYTYKYTQSAAQLFGGELLVDFHPHPWDFLHFQNAFSFVNARSLAKNATDSTKFLPFIPAARYQSEVRIVCKKGYSVFQNLFFKAEYNHFFAQNRIYSANNTETATPAYSLVNFATGLDIIKNKKIYSSVYFSLNNIFDVAYQNHLNRLKYTAENPVSGRMGVFNMGRNVSFKWIVPLEWRLKG
jgi:iron complex outermembrane receptor protein